MSAIFWLASYPKSGNTWLRFLASNLVFGEVHSAADLVQMAPDLHELGTAFQPPEHPLLMKTHFRFTPQLRFAELTAGAIYIMRDPADVLVSNFHYSERSGGQAKDGGGAFSRYLDAFIVARGDPRWAQMGMGSWEENVRSWLGQQQRFPVLVVRYEDLLLDAVGVAGRICECLGLEHTRATIAAAVVNSSFDRMRTIEEADIDARRVGIFYKPYLQTPIDGGLRFMRSGLRGEAGRLFSKEQWQRFNAAFGELRQEFGYH